MIGRILMTAGMVAALAACSTAAPAGVYVKPGVTSAQSDRDRAECAARAAASDQRTLVLSASEREAVDACMRARGYTRQAERR